MTHPLRRRFLPSPILAVAAPRKPYYNPANLRKAAGCVKKKECIEGIGEFCGEGGAAHQRGGAASGHFILGLARLGDAGLARAGADAEPLPSVYGRGRAAAAARDVFAARARLESGRDCARSEAARRGFDAGGRIAASRAAIPAAAAEARAVAGASGASDGRLRGISERARARANAAIHCDAAADCAFLPDKYSFAFGSRGRESAAGEAGPAKSAGNDA